MHYTILNLRSKNLPLANAILHNFSRGKYTIMCFIKIII